MALVHGRPDTAWRAPMLDASDDELTATYGPLGHAIAVYAHIHRPYIRSVGRIVVANTGSVSLPYSGDPRAAYLLLDGSEPMIRRVEYDVEAEISALKNCGMPHSDWIASMLRTGRFQTP
jgi:predicted phosphodiesterase